MEFKEKCSGRWAFFLGGLFWTAAIPCVYAIAFKQIMQEKMGNIIFITIAMGLLLFGSLLMLYHGLNDIISNGKKHLVVDDEGVQIIVNGIKNRGKIYAFKYDQMLKFYFCSDGIKINQKTGEISIKKGSSGAINFSISKKYLPSSILTPKQERIMQKYHLKELDFSACIYNALPAAQFILSKLDTKQIDHTHNELTKSGKVVIIDEESDVLDEETLRSLDK